MALEEIKVEDLLLGYVSQDDKGTDQLEIKALNSRSLNEIHRFLGLFQRRLRVMAVVSDPDEKGGTKVIA